MDEREAARHQLFDLMAEVAQDKGVELPSIPDTPERQAYLSFLERMRYSEDELLPVFEGERATGEMYGALLMALMKALDSDDTDFVKSIFWMLHNVFDDRDNTNLIIYELTRRLLRELPFQRDRSRFSLYPGVYPTDSFNAQCCFADNTALVLIDTGAMEMAEAFVISFVSKRSKEQKRDEMFELVERYVTTASRADPYTANSKGIDWGSGIVSVLVNSFEEALLAHELGHLVLGHVQPDQVRHHSPILGEGFEVAEKKCKDEYEADVWACRALLERSVQHPTNDAATAIAIAGMWMALGVALLVEGVFQKQGVPFGDTHPPAAARLYMVQITCELLGFHEEIGIGHSFLEILLSVLQSWLPDIEPPPMLSRELNAELIPVLENLGIDYSNAPYITEFL